MKIRRIKISNFFRQYSDAFDLDDRENGRTSIVRHKIDTEDARYIRQTNCSMKNRGSGTNCEEHPEGVIKLSDNLWASPVFLVKKKDDSKRFLRRQPHSQPHHKEFDEPRIFFTLELRSGYRVVELYDEDKKKTAFIV